MFQYNWNCTVIRSQVTGDCRPSSLLLAQIGIVKSKTSRVRMVFSLFFTWKYYYAITITIIICISIHVIYMRTLSQSDCIIIIINIIYFLWRRRQFISELFHGWTVSNGPASGSMFFSLDYFFLLFFPAIDCPDDWWQLCGVGVSCHCLRSWGFLSLSPSLSLTTFVNRSYFSPLYFHLRVDFDDGSNRFRRVVVFFWQHIRICCRTD